MHNLSALYNNSANVQLFYPQNPEEACLTNGVIIGKIFSFLTDVKSQVSFMTANKHIYYVLNDRIMSLMIEKNIQKQLKKLSEH